MIELLTPSDLKGRPLRLVGDVHGNLAAFEPVVKEALDQGRFIVQLGDLVDYGDDNPGCLRLMRQLMERRQGVMVRGNHDDKFLRYLQGRPVNRRGTGLAATVAQVKQAPDRNGLRDFVLTVTANLPYWLDLDGLFCVHAAYKPELHEIGDLRPLLRRSHPRARALRAHVLFGENDGRRRPDGYPLRTYHWVTDIPPGLTVVIGHDVRSTDKPVLLSNDQGGRCVMLDTGSSKGGHLSWIDADPTGDPVTPWRFTPGLDTLKPALLEVE